MVDSDLVWRATKGDLSAFSQLVTKYQRLVFGVAFHSLQNFEDARDVSQDVFIRAFTRLHQLQDGSRIGSWLRQITLNECRAHKERRREFFPLTEYAAVTNPHLAIEDRLILRDALDSIDEKGRLTTILFYLDSYTIREIASFLDEPETTIKSRLRNSRAKLRQELGIKLKEELDEKGLPDNFGDHIKEIIEAVSAGNEEVVKALLSKDPRLVEVREAPSQGTPLHIAAGIGNSAMVELLLKFGADPNALDQGDNASPLHYAAERGRVEAVKLLIAAGAEVNFNGDLHERGPLGWATVFDPTQFEVAELLLAHGAKFDLFSAIALGRLDVVQKLVDMDSGAIHQRLSEFDGRRSAIQFATEKRQFEIAEYLAARTPELSLVEAAALGRDGLVAELLKENPELNDPLHAAVRAAQAGTTRLLLQMGADPNGTQFGRPAIFTAILEHDRLVAELLLEFGADLEFKDPQWKSTALGWAVFFGNAAGARLALELGAQLGAHVADLARSGERGELRRWSPAKAEDYARVLEILGR